MKKTVAIIQARMDSSRLPGKVLMELSEKAILQWCVDAAYKINGVDDVVVATSTEANDDQIQKYCAEHNINVFRGSKNNVLKRIIDAAKAHKAETIIRITADCPFLDADVCSSLLYLYNTENCDYASNVQPPSWPDGLDCEVFSVHALEKSLEISTSEYELEHVTVILQNNQKIFTSCNLTCPISSLSQERWTLDDQGDFDFLSAIAKHLDGKSISYVNILNILKKHPKIYDTRNAANRNDGAKHNSTQHFFNSKTKRSFKNSEIALARSLKSIPIGSQTFSKSKSQFPPGASPLFLTHGQGGHVWDVDGNEYIDLICGLLPISLGYCDNDIDDAIRAQLHKGISFSLATELEADLAERMINLIPSAEMVRFGKNGTDATSAAIRLARAYTGQDRILALGYHGWQDWYIGSTTRNLGVPKSVSDLTTRLPYNDIDCIKEALSKNKGEYAAIIMEAASVEEPHTGYLEEIRVLTKQENIVLIFDEIIMGFRQHIGGAQAYYGVTPDLSCFGKGMANGMPLSAIVGKEHIMTLMNDIFYSGTFGGEALSLAASIATIDKMIRVNAIDHMHNIGDQIANAVTEIIARNDLSAVFKLIGIAPWKIMSIRRTKDVAENIIQTRFLTEMFNQGILTGGTHNICYAHNDEDVSKTIKAYENTMAIIKDELDTRTIEKNLTADPIEPIFKVRG